MAEPDPARKAGDRQRERSVGEKLGERRVAIASGDDHGRELADLRIRRVDVQPRIGNVGDVRDSVLLQPERRASKVIAQRIPVVRRREERERADVQACEGDDDGEGEDHGLPKGAPGLCQRGTRVGQRRPAAEVPDDDCGDQAHTDGGEQRPASERTRRRESQ